MASSATQLDPPFCWCFDWLTLLPWKLRLYMPLNCRAVSKLQGVTIQKAMLFIYIPQEPWTQVLPSCVLCDTCVSINSATQVHCHQSLITLGITYSTSLASTCLSNSERDSPTTPRSFMINMRTLQDFLVWHMLWVVMGPLSLFISVN
jgi:hypothetical protein